MCAQGMHDGLGQMGMQPPHLLLGPVVHFDGRDHRRNLSRSRPGHRSGGGGPVHGPVGGHGGHMLAGGIN